MRFIFLILLLLQSTFSFAGFITCKPSTNLGAFLGEVVDATCDNGLKFQYVGILPSAYMDPFNLETFHLYCFRSEPYQLTTSVYTGGKFSLGLGVIGLSGALFQNRFYEPCVMLGSGWLTLGWTSTIGTLTFSK